MTYWFLSRRVWTVLPTLAVILVVASFPSLFVTLPSRTAAEPYVRIPLAQVVGLLPAIVWAAMIPSVKANARTYVRPLKLIDSSPLLLIVLAVAAAWAVSRNGDVWQVILRNSLGMAGLTLLTAAVVGMAVAPLPSVLLFVVSVFVGDAQDGSGIQPWAFVRYPANDVIGLWVGVIVFALGFIAYNVNPARYRAGP